MKMETSGLKAAVSQVGAREKTLAELKQLSDEKGWDWSKVQDFVQNLGLPILMMVLEYLKRFQPPQVMGAGDHCDHACCCCDCFEAIAYLTELGKAHCECLTECHGKTA